MGELLPLLVVAGAIAAIMGFFAWLASVVRRRGLAGTAIRAAMASYDEAFHVTAYDSHYEIRAQAERKVPIVSPDDPWKPSRGGIDQPGGTVGRPSSRPHSHPRRRRLLRRRRLRRPGRSR